MIFSQKRPENATAPVIEIITEEDKMSWFQGQALNRKTEIRKKEKQAKLPSETKKPKTYNGSKSIPGEWPVIFEKARNIK